MNIQIMKTYSKTFDNVNSHKLEWIKVAYGPVLIWALGFLFLVLAYVASGQVLDVNTFAEGAQSSAPTPPLLTIASIVYHVVYFLALTSLYINGYRYAILGEGGDRWITLNFNMRLVKLILFNILFGLLALIYVGIAAGIIIGAHFLLESVALDVILGLILGLCGFYLLFRIALFPVVISMDKSSPLTTSWHLMKGNVLRFFGLMMLITLTVMLIVIIAGAGVALFGFLLGMINGLLGVVVGIVLGLLLAFFLIVFGWALNSKAMGLVYLELLAKKAS